MNTFTRTFALLAAGSMGLGIGLGCAGRPALLPNPDKSLRRSSAEFAADAAKRHPYKAEVPRGGEAAARAQVATMLDRIELVNLSDEDWTDVEVWVNQQYVVHVPQVQRGKLKILNFQMIYDDQGRYLPTNTMRLAKLEVFRDGKMYDVPLQLAD